VVVIGHSFGGRVALQLAVANPDRIAALVLTGVPLGRPPGATRRAPAVRYRLGRALYRRRLISDAWMERLRHRYGSEDYRQASGAMRDVLVKAVNETYQSQLEAFSGPIELLWGADDDQVPVSVAQSAMASCRQPNLRVIPGVGHFLPLDAPEALIEAVSRHRPAGAGPPAAAPPRTEPERPEPERPEPERPEHGRPAS
jgi:pimeloyl-ACP methyl ester carboxylesterase